MSMKLKIDTEVKGCINTAEAACKNRVKEPRSTHYTDFRKIFRKPWDRNESLSAAWMVGSITQTMCIRIFPFKNSKNVNKAESLYTITKPERSIAPMFEVRIHNGDEQSTANMHDLVCPHTDELECALNRNGVVDNMFIKQNKFDAKVQSSNI
uniref:Uncharacterized protein n=1 Tax=Glossina austeni TaxID=7395 RepID=A0A1A9UGN3_GLOAU